MKWASEKNNHFGYKLADVSCNTCGETCNTIDMHQRIVTTCVYDECVPNCANGVGRY